MHPVMQLTKFLHSTMSGWSFLSDHMLQRTIDQFFQQLKLCWRDGSKYARSTRYRQKVQTSCGPPEEGRAAIYTRGLLHCHFPPPPFLLSLPLSLPPSFLPLPSLFLPSFPPPQISLSLIPPPSPLTLAWSLFLCHTSQEQISSTTERSRSQPHQVPGRPCHHLATGTPHERTGV